MVAATVQPKPERWLLIERWLEATGSTPPENAVATVLLGKRADRFRHHNHSQSLHSSPRIGYIQGQSSGRVTNPARMGLRSTYRQ